ncbi:hypothetical protein B0G62_10493 [Paraburkholderia eburnea]|uniref:Uncharacterized protein n=1 Tax=Paraburkholderia eburnea TaxID=1189126 RepID=A0A2S4MDH6_9BURK|nr:hypothetical protein [Paraburkholderia eburnea]POR52796.1 hypothetical protein B0G62_10493 [Paraburkholderia eburnea]PRZ23664.1 hypothetical protein BX588_10493 [Paraburkholderia eburnea]
MDGQKFEQWALVELFGHQRIAGRVSDLTVGGQSFVRVDVPACEATDDEPALQPFTKAFGPGAIYGITFLDEGAARMFVRQLRVQPIGTWELRRALQDLPAGRRAQAQLDMADDDAPM